MPQSSGSSFKRIGSILDQQVPPLRSLVDPRRQKFYDELWSTIAGPALAANTRIRVSAKGVVVVYANSSVWGHKLVHLRQSLIKSLQAAGMNATKLHVRVTPTEFVHYNLQKPEAKRAKLSEHSARFLEKFSKTLDDENLAESFRKLSRHGKT